MSELDVAAQAAAAEVKAENAQEDIKEIEQELNSVIEDTSGELETIEQKQKWNEDDIASLFDRFYDLEQKVEDALGRIELLEMEIDKQAASITEDVTEDATSIETEDGTSIETEDEPQQEGGDKGKKRKHKKGAIGLW